MENNNCENIQKYLTDNTFYYCSYPSFKKFGIFTFESDGRISGSHGQFEQRYEVTENHLKMFNEAGREVTEFQFEDKIGKITIGKSKFWANLSLALVQKDTKDVNVIRPVPQKDQKNLGTFLASPYYEQAKNLALDGKTIDGYDHGEYFVVNNADTPLGMERYQKISYKIEEADVTKNYLSKKMLVLFNSSLNLMSVSALDRQAPENNYSSLHKFLCENTILLRIADSNLISGSYYQNTKNFLDYEVKIQELIKKIAFENDIPLSNIVCYGTSKGGIGALTHGLLGNYPVVVFDPMINREEFLVNGDEHFCFDLIPIDFTEKINFLLANTTMRAGNIKIYTCESVKMTFSYISKLSHEKCEILNVKFDENIFAGLSEREKHNKFLNLIFPYQASYINELLRKCDTERIV